MSVNFPIQIKLRCIIYFIKIKKGRKSLRPSLFKVERIYDVGVAGIHKLYSRLELIRGGRVIVAVAGMEGALPGVIGGME